jgi:hypothetical protein
MLYSLYGVGMGHRGYAGCIYLVNASEVISGIGISISLSNEKW